MRTFYRLYISVLLAASSMSLFAEDFKLGGTDWSVTGFLREEASLKTTNDLNGYNQQGIATNGVAVPNTGLGGPAGFNINPTLTRPATIAKDNDLNMLATRLEISLDGKLTDSLSAHFKLRGIADGVGQVEDSFENKNFYRQEFHDSNGGTPLEVANDQWAVDFPTAYLDFNHGPLWVRVGNQQIAWGEALFFRVSDVVNGLDLRRHLVLDPAAEEYSDKRVPALGVRASYRIKDAWEVEGFVQKFEPNILPGENSPFNVIPAQFVIHEQEGYDEVDDAFNFGGRLSGDIGKVGVKAFGVHRYNPAGVYRWTEATGVGAVAGTPFQAGTGVGVFSAQEWFNSASMARLNGIGGLDSALNEFPATTGLGANVVAGLCGATSAAVGGVVDNSASASCVLDTFFDPTVGLGELRGHLLREYRSEDIFGVSFNTVFEGEPGGLLDQLIGRVEVSYTPNRTLTNPTLSRDYIKTDETQFALIFEKYHKFSTSVPATYIVAQYLFQSATDLFGRALEGLDNKPGAVPGEQDYFQAVAIALQQPSPTLQWRFDFTMLTDTQGGWLFQPGVRFRPNKNFQLDLYANMLISTHDGIGGKDFAQGLEFANDVFMRAAYYF